MLDIALVGVLHTLEMFDVFENAFSAQTGKAIPMIGNQSRKFELPVGAVVRASTFLKMQIPK